MTKVIAVFALCFLLSGCWNGENVHVRMGDVSLGQQLIDLKTALDEDAITEKEYARTKQRLLALASLCENTDDDDDEHHHHRDRDRDDRHKNDDDQEEEEEDSGFNWF